MWTFIWGSLGFQWVALCDLVETIQLHRQTGEEAAQIANCSMFNVGSLLFLVGSILFLPGYPEVVYKLSTVLFVIGSMVFSFAAFINVTEVRVGADIAAEQLKLAITGLYLVGGVLFTVGAPSPHQCVLVL